MRFIFPLIFLAVSFDLNVNAEYLETLMQWPFIDYVLPYDNNFRGRYRPENVVPTGIEVSWRRIFISLPRLRQGVPATLAYIPRNVPLGSSPKLQPYPSWEWHSAGKGEFNCSQLISVYRTRLDRCNRLWVVDSGVMMSLDNFTPICPPKLLVFDLHTDTVVRQYTFPREVLRLNTLLTNLVIDDTKSTSCDDVFVYMSDTTGPGIQIFDGANNTSWRVLHASMLPNPDYTIYQLGDENFELPDGIVGLAFSPRLGMVYYQPLATDRLFGVPTSALQNGPLPFGQQLPVTLIGRKSSQGLPLTVDPYDDSIFFSPIRETAIANWQPQTNSQRIVAYSPEKLQFTADLRWTVRDDGKIWILSTRFHKFFNRRVTSQEINIRIMRLVPETVLSKNVPIYQYINSHLLHILYNNTIGLTTKMINWVLWFIAVLSCSTICNCELNNKMKIIYSWKALDFAFPSERARAIAIKQGTFIPGAPIPIDVDLYHKERQGSIIFVTIPRFIKGIPVTFGYVTDDVTPEGNPIIAPYPSWEWNKEGDCNVITSVFRVAIDKCNRLWILDTGKVGNHQICRPQLHVFSLINNRLIHQYKFPRDQFKDTSLFVTPVVDIRDTDDKCRNTFVYVADVTGFGLLVYDHTHNRSWRIENKLFFPYPPYGTFNINGDTFDLMDGIIALALGPIRSDGDRILYFHSLASKVESWVATSTIRNYSIFLHDSEATPRSFKPFLLERPSQSAAEAMNKNGVLFFGLLSEISLACWNSKNYPEYSSKNIENLLVDQENLQFPSGLKLKYSKEDREEIWILTSSFQRFMTGTLNPNETNFRILAGFVNELVRGTKCDSVTHVHGPVTFPK
ncbi:uncharacterized protein LOC118446767 [Vespa mandarinia]|uniref:uncharacterized protein LOC118446767 n=1 Tax=Vespa mandarinia TaxID=7446 RepID=UPI001613D3BA|nr:uncharacterized protein LOC118446767 [Vespa mandarinia]